MRIGKVKAKWQWKEKEWKEEVQQVIIEKTKTLLSRVWQYPLHQVPPVPPSCIPKLTIQFHPDKGISSSPPPTHHPFIPLFISLFSPTNGNNNTQQHNNQQFTVRPFSNLTSKSKLLRMMGLLIKPLKFVPVRERDMSESCEECNWQVLVWSSHPVCQRIPYSAGQQSRRLLYASIRCRRQDWFCLTLDYSDTLRQPANSQ